MKLTVSGQDMSGEATVYLMLVPRAGVRLEADVPVSITFEPLEGVVGTIRFDAKTPLRLSDAAPAGEMIILPTGAEQVFFINVTGNWKVTFRERP